MKNKILFTLSVLVSIVVMVLLTEIMDKLSTFANQFNEQIRTVFMLFNMGIMFGVAVSCFLLVFYCYSRTVTNSVA